jgi:hypothetical protein
MKFQDEKIWNRGPEVCRRQGAHRAADVVRRHWDGLSVGKLRDLGANCQAPNLLQIRGGDPHSMRLQYFPESFEQIQLLPVINRDPHPRTHCAQGCDAALEPFQIGGTRDIPDERAAPVVCLSLEPAA